MSNNNIKNMILRLFADNTVGNITASTLRDFISAIFDDKEVVINKFRNLQEFETSDKSNIYEGSLVVVYDSPTENGLYFSKSNQPSSIDLLTKLTTLDQKSEDTKIYEYVAQPNQNIFACEYSDDKVQVFIDGKKLKQSQIITNGTSTITLKTPLNGGEDVEIYATKSL